MGISIKRRDTVEVVRQLAQARDISLTDAIHDAAVKALRDIGVQPVSQARRIADMEAWFRELDARPRTGKTMKEIEDEMYDEWGSPR